MGVNVTIGVCVKDGEKTIRETINSIVDQKYPTELMQLIIVDGRSKDKTLPIVASTTSKTDMKVEIYSDKGRGLGAARQIAVDHTNGKYIIFVDADVRIFDDFVKSHVKFMEENPYVGVAFGKLVHQEGTLVSMVWDLAWYSAEVLVGTDATIFRPEALRQVGGFDVNIKGAAEDRDLIARIQEKGWLISFNEEARFFHRFRENIRDFWDEQAWFGYGDHYFRHKRARAGEGKTLNPVWRKLPFGYFTYGLRTSLKAYELTHRKISLLIPLQMVLGNIAWWVGFIKGHMDGYGHIS